MTTAERVQGMLGFYKLKYSQLDKLLKDKPAINNIHINCDSILTDFCKNMEKCADDVDNKLSISIVSSFINLVGHYKHYFTKKGQKVNIYLYFYSFFKDKTNLHEELNEAINLINSMCEYIPNVYFIRSVSQQASVTMKYFCKGINLVMSRSILDMLLVRDNVYGIRIRNKDNCTLYDNDNFYATLLKDDKEYDISPCFSSIVLSYVGYKHLKGVKGIGPHKITKMISKALREKRIINGRYPDVRSFVSDMGSMLSGVDNERAIRNFYEIDVDYNYIKLIEVNKAVKSRLDNYIITKNSTGEFLKVVNKYFKDENVITTHFLFEEPIPNGGRKIIW